MNASFIGSHLLGLAFPAALFSSLFYLVGASQNKKNLVLAARRATTLSFVLITAAVATLIAAFLTNDFSLLYVHNYSSSSLPVFYKLTGLWAGLDGSILFWTWLVSLYSVIVLAQHKGKNDDWLPVVNAVMMGVILFFLGLILFAQNPFTPLGTDAADGRGLNPLLQNIAMVVHPPALYMGFTGFTVPFAFVVAALVTRRLDSTWIDLTRRWTLVPWGFLTLGLILGGAWAYVELGWGGFWAWDPVENAALMPWLLGTAYLHSVMVQKKRGMLMAWNVCLIILTFLLTIFGTYLTRSGVVQSVHAFSEGNLGPFFLGFMGAIFFFSLYLILTRWPDLKGKPLLVSVASKESAFVLNNIIFVVACFAVIWGTLFPTLTEAVMGQRVTVGIPFFNRIMAPIGLILLALMGIGPMISWKKGTMKNFTSNLALPLAAGGAAGALAVGMGITQWYAAGSAALITFVLATLVLEFARGMRVVRIQQKTSWAGSFVELFSKARRRYGGYIVHLGALLIFMGIAGTLYKGEADFSLMPGKDFAFRGYRFHYVEPNMERDEHRANVSATVVLFRGDSELGTLIPAKNFYFTSEQPSTEAAVYQTFLEDVYLIIGVIDPESKRADFRVTVNPMISFVWAGGFVILLGILILLAPKGMKAPSALVLVGALGLSLMSVTASAQMEASPMHQEEGGDPFIVLPPGDARLPRLKGLCDKIICQCGGCVRMALSSCTCGFAKEEKQKLLSLMATETDDEILGRFIQRYGLTVLATPPETGFFRIGYWAPPVVTVLALLFGGALIWKKRKRYPGGAGFKAPPPLALDDEFAKALKKELED
ncbi:MAG: cytochrome c-type biogenesis CcmF C-terminal domain-containing protein [Deltaproteobacteria bacterium]|nr:cytochrome c-type biogenesis CcmF C-terminal domain-containing protein [Deltaproteobacteria bacterium]